MRITTTSIKDFIANLNGVGVYRGVVYYERSKQPLNGKTKRDATVFDIVYQTSAVLEFGEEGQALLVCGIDCGVDRLTGDGGYEGTRRQELDHEKLLEYCAANDLRLLPGVLDQ